MTNKPSSSEIRTGILGRMADEMFRKRGIDPALATSEAFLAEDFRLEDLGFQIELRRNICKIARPDLAERAGYDKNTLADWAAGTHSARIQTAVDFAGALGFDVMVNLVPSEQPPALPALRKEGPPANGRVRRRRGRSIDGGGNRDKASQWLRGMLAGQGQGMDGRPGQQGGQAGQGVLEGAGQGHRGQAGEGDLA